jgi:hypothetical protein
MPAALGALTSLAEPAGWNIAAGEHPIFAPFAEGANPPLSEVLFLRRFAIASAAPDAEVLCSHADGTPAIIHRRIGRGSAMLWNFSPDRPFSNLHSLAQLPILVDSTVRFLTGSTETPAMVTLGQSVTLPLPREFRPTMTTIRRGPGRPAEPVPVYDQAEAITLHADRVGDWAVEFAAEDRKASAGFSVNADPAESDLTPIGPEKLATLFAPGHVTTAADLQELAAADRTVARPLELLAPILLVLLALLVGESWFANRFYRQPAAPADSQAPRGRPGASA